MQRASLVALLRIESPLLLSINKFFVMAGLVPAIHVFCASALQFVDARDEPGRDGKIEAAE